MKGKYRAAGEEVNNAIVCDCSLKLTSRSLLPNNVTMAVSAVDPAFRRWINPQNVAATALFLATFAVFWPVRNHQFINIDDISYVFKNKVVTRGLTGEGLRWAFTSVGYAANWHPLTWISHMLDVQLFGLAPGWHHMTSVLIHAVSGVLLFGILRSMTGAVGRSAAVAALFGLHPLRAESVVWIAERKDVLSGLFWMVTLLAYLRWMRRPQPGRYLAVIAAFALGLLSKPVLVTLPFVLLLLDFWPLGRLRLPVGAPVVAPCATGVRFSRLLLEKAPFLALSIASSVITLIAQAESLGRTQPRSFAVRLLNAVLSYGVYLKKTVWPTDLMFFYPNPVIGPDSREVLAAALLLVAITIVALRSAGSRPFFLTGWLWYLGVLVPVIGLVQQSGSAAMADRYTYLPVIGVFIAGAWGLPDLFPAWRHRGRVLAALSVAALLLLAALTTRQVKTMRDDETLYRHMLAADPADGYARTNLGVALIEQGRLADGTAVLSKMFRSAPLQLSRVHLQRAAQLSLAGKADEALACYTKALALDPNAEAVRAIALLSAAGGRMPPGSPPSWTSKELLDEAEAVVWFRQADSLAASEHFEFALDYYRQALQLKPDLADAWNNLGGCYGRLDRHQEAAAAFEKAIAADPGNERARNNLEQARRSLRR